ncbi:MAG: chemotaxis response regulator protein-glutamate methylesterase [Pseudomonadota bacterium]
MREQQKIRVLVIDDSAVMRQLLSAILSEDPAIDVVGTASDPLIAREKIKILKPHVLTLDVEMPGMDGLTFLERLMRLHPLPVVMVSSFTDKGAQATIRALELGAVDFVTKPSRDVRVGIQELAQEIRDKVHAAMHARVQAPGLDRETLSCSPPPISMSPAASDRVVVIGASAGGTQAIAEILELLPAHAPAIAIVQHMPPKFTELFAANLDKRCRLNVSEAVDGEFLRPGNARIAPGGQQMELMRGSEAFGLRVYPGGQVHRHCPSVDVLFNSTACCAGKSALGILLTGMGNDGAKGLLAMWRNGAHTVAQDEATSVIFGMPDQAIRLGAAREVLGLGEIAACIMRWASSDQPWMATST